MSLITSNLFDETLMEPLRQGANRLYVVSGYATGTMVLSHDRTAKDSKLNLSVHLIHGMAVQDGVEISNHTLLQELDAGKYTPDLKCRYIVNRPPVHAKVYAWYRDEEPVVGYVGSANYTLNAFGEGKMREVLLETDPVACLNYYNGLLGESVSCNDANIENMIKTHRRNEPKKIAPNEEETEAVGELGPENFGLPFLRLPLITKVRGVEELVVPDVSGLNWGQRGTRNRNEAYIPVPAHIMRSGFFPAKNEHFTVLTDDGKELIMAIVSGVIGKHLQTPLDNSRIGEYFRYRLGVPENIKFTREDLERYGRTDVTFLKEDEETYRMDFSVR